MHTHSQACIHMCTFILIHPHSQICLLLLSEPAVQSSIICIHHLHTAATFIPSFPSPSPLHIFLVLPIFSIKYAKTFFFYKSDILVNIPVSFSELSNWMTATLFSHISFVLLKINNFFSICLSQKRARELQLPDARRCTCS